MKNFFTILFFVTLASQSFAQYHWRAFLIPGETYASRSYETIATSDNGHLMDLIGYLTHPTHTGVATDMVKTDSADNIMWGKRYSLCDTCKLVPAGYFELSSGGFIVTAYSGGFNDSLCIIRIDSAGGVLWSKFYIMNATFVQLSFSIQQPDDQSLILHNSNVFTKIDTSGNVLWSKKFSPVTPSPGFISWGKLTPTSDSGYVCLIKNIYSVSPPMYKMGLVKFDQSLNVQWTKSYADSINFLLTNIKEIAGGYLFSKGPTLIRTDLFGDTLWTRTYEFDVDSGQFNYMYFDFDSAGLILTSNGFYSHITGGQQIIFKTDSSGLPQWTNRHYSTDAFNTFGPVFKTINGYKIYGSTGLGTGAPSPSIIRTDMSGNYGCPVDTTMIVVRPNAVQVSTETIIDSTFLITASILTIIEEDTIFSQVDLCTITAIDFTKGNSDFSLYPNPSIENITISSGKHFNKILISDVSGRTVYELTGKLNEKTFNVSNFAPGLYIISIVYNDGIVTKKFIVR